MRLAELRGRRLALWGFGREGRATLRVLREHVADLDVTVLDDTALPADATADLGGLPVVIGDAVGEALRRFDVVIKSPGISLYRPEVAAARDAGTVLTSATQIWFDEHADTGITTVCVTGTKGKSTTASLVAHLLAAAGRRVELRGNIGRPLLDVGEPGSDAVWVIEISSYQAADLRADPTVAVLLNLYPEHLDWHGEVETYLRDKLHLFAHQDSGVAVVDRRDPEITRRSAAFRKRVYFNDEQGFHVDHGFVCRRSRRLLDVHEILLPGAHNHSNVCAALTVLDCLGVEPPLDAVATFRGLPHRLFVVGERDGVLFVDDSISTTPQSAMAAIATYTGRPVTVLLGGLDRGIAYDGLAAFLAERRVHAAVTFAQSGPRIAAEIRRAATAGRPTVHEAGSLDEAVIVARRITPSGGVVLLSPAAPSFGVFRDYRERGERFAKAAFRDP